MKGGNGYTEDAAIEALRESTHLVIICAREEMQLYGEVKQPIGYVEAERAWELLAILSGLYKTIILDELNQLLI